MAIGVRGGVSEAWSRWRCSLEARFGLGHSVEVHVVGGMVKTHDGLVGAAVVEMHGGMSGCTKWSFGG